MGLIVLFIWAAGLVLLVGAALVTQQLLLTPRRTLGYALGKRLPTDPTQVGLEFEEHTFTLADGTPSPGWIMTGRDPSGPVVVVAHGWAEGRYDVLPRLPVVTRFASHLVLYDQRGHGEASAKLCRLGTREVDDLIAILDQLDTTPEIRRTHNEARYVLLGYSMGGGVVIATGARLGRERIIAVIAEGPCRRLREGIKGLLRGMGFPTFPFNWLGPVLAEPWAWGISRADRARDAAKLTMPLLVLHGANDPVCPTAAARAISQAAPRGHWVEFPDAGHLGLALTDESRYFDALKQVLTKERT